MRKDVPKAKEHEGLNQVDQGFPYSYWVGFLASTLTRVAVAKTLVDAKKEAREALGSVTDPHIGVREIDPDIRRTWRDAARREDEDE